MIGQSETTCRDKRIQSSGPRGWGATWIESHQVAVDDAGRVEALERAQQLVHEELEVFVAQQLRRANDAVQIGLHQLGDQVEVVEVARTRTHHAVQLHHLKSKRK